MGIARQHMDRLHLVAGHLKVQHLISIDLALLNEAMSCYNNN